MFSNETKNLERFTSEIFLDSLNRTEIQLYSSKIKNIASAVCENFYEESTKLQALALHLENVETIKEANDVVDKVNQIFARIHNQTLSISHLPLELCFKIFNLTNSNKDLKNFRLVNQGFDHAIIALQIAQSIKVIPSLKKIFEEYSVQYKTLVTLAKRLPSILKDFSKQRERKAYIDEINIYIEKNKENAFSFIAACLLRTIKMYPANLRWYEQHFQTQELEVDVLFFEDLIKKCDLIAAELESLKKTGISVYQQTLPSLRKQFSEIFIILSSLDASFFNLSSIRTKLIEATTILPFFKPREDFECVNLLMKASACTEAQDISKLFLKYKLGFFQEPFFNFLGNSKDVRDQFYGNLRKFINAIVVCVAFNKINAKIFFEILQSENRQFPFLFNTQVDCEEDFIRLYFRHTSLNNIIDYFSKDIEQYQNTAVLNLYILYEEISKKDFAFIIEQLLKIRKLPFLKLISFLIKENPVTLDQIKPLTQSFSRLEYHYTAVFLYTIQRIELAYEFIKSFSLYNNWSPLNPKLINDLLCQRSNLLDQLYLLHHIPYEEIKAGKEIIFETLGVSEEYQGILLPLFRKENLLLGEGFANPYFPELKDNNIVDHENNWINLVIYASMVKKDVSLAKQALSMVKERMNRQCVILVERFYQALVELSPQEQLVKAPLVVYQGQNRSIYLSKAKLSTQIEFAITLYRNNSCHFEDYLDHLAKNLFSSPKISIHHFAKACQILQQIKEIQESEKEFFKTLVEHYIHSQVVKQTHSNPAHFFKVLKESLPEKILNLSTAITDGEIYYNPDFFYKNYKNSLMVANSKAIDFKKAWMYLKESFAFSEFLEMSHYFLQTYPIQEILAHPSISWSIITRDLKLTQQILFDSSLTHTMALEIKDALLARNYNNQIELVKGLELLFICYQKFPIEINDDQKMILKGINQVLYLFGYPLLQENLFEQNSKQEFLNVFKECIDFEFLKEEFTKIFNLKFYEITNSTDLSNFKMAFLEYIDLMRDLVEANYSLDLRTFNYEEKRKILLSKTFIKEVPELLELFQKVIHDLPRDQLKRKAEEALPEGLTKKAKFE